MPDQLPAISAGIARIVAEEDEVARQKRVIRYNAIELAKGTVREALTALQNEMLDGPPEEDEMARLRAALKNARRAALLETIAVEPLGGDHIDAGGWFTGYAAGCKAKTAAIAALIEGTK